MHLLNYIILESINSIIRIFVPGNTWINPNNDSKDLSNKWASEYSNFYVFWISKNNKKNLVNGS